MFDIPNITIFHACSNQFNFELIFDKACLKGEKGRSGMEEGVMFTKFKWEKNRNETRNTEKM